MYVHTNHSINWIGPKMPLHDQVKTVFICDQMMSKIKFTAFTKTKLIKCLIHFFYINTNSQKWCLCSKLRIRYRCYLSRLIEPRNCKTNKYSWLSKRRKRTIVRKNVILHSWNVVGVSALPPILILTKYIATFEQ